MLSPPRVELCLAALTTAAAARIATIFFACILAHFILLIQWESETTRFWGMRCKMEYISQFLYLYMKNIITSYQAENFRLS